jgi:hypothetical protein
MAVAYQPETYMKVTCIEGKVTVRLKSLAGEFIQLVAGQMVIINPTEKRLPEVVEFDLDEFSRTSSLLGGEFPSLGSADSINNAISRQAREIGDRSITATPLLLEGAGPEVLIDGQTGIEGQRPVELEPVPPPPEPPPPDRPPPDSGPSNGGGHVPPPTPTGPLDFIIDATTIYDPSLATISTPGVGTIQGTLTSASTTYTFPNNDSVNSPELLINSPGAIPPASSPQDIYSVQGLARIQGSVQNGSPLLISAASGVDIVGADIFDSSSSGVSLSIGSGAGINLSGSTIRQIGGVSLNAQGAVSTGPIDVSNSIVESQAADVNIISSSSNGASPAITVRNSSELLALAAAAGAPVGSVRLLTQGGRIVVDGSNVEAGNEILIDTQNPAVPSLVELRNATMSADVIRARGFNNGLNDALLIDGGTYNASRLIKFYAEGASTLRFRGNVTLNSIGVDIAGQRVSVDLGGVVNAPSTSSFRVFSDDHDYNRTGRGTITTATGQVIQLPFDSRPPF